MHTLLTLCDCIFYELLHHKICRAVPVAYTTNLVCAITQLGPYFLAKGTGVHMNLWAMQHDERYWQDAEAFKPERWIGDKIGGDRSGGLAYMPFGVGPRMCIGIKLACKRVNSVAMCTPCYHLVCPALTKCIENCRACRPMLC